MLAPPEYLTSPAQIAPGSNWIWSRIPRELEWQALADNTRANLRVNWGMPPPANAKSPPNAPLNWYRRIQTFWSSALWAQPPTLGTPIEPDWIPELIAASNQRSAKGLGVCRLTGRRLIAVDTSHYFPIVNPQDISEITHHVIAIPFTLKPQMGTLVEPADRINITIYPVKPESPATSTPATVWTATYHLEGQKLGMRVNRRRTEWQQIITWGDWASDFVDPKPIIELFEERLTKVHNSLNHHNEPHIAGPASSIPTQTEDLPSFQDGVLLPRQEGDPPWEYIQPNADGYAASFTELRWLEDQIHILSSIPATVFGKAEDQRAQVSGTARERQMYAALQKIRRLRAEVAPALRAISGGGTRIDWPDDPFATYHERAETLVALKQAEIIDGPSALERLHE